VGKIAEKALQTAFLVILPTGL